MLPEWIGTGASVAGSEVRWSRATLATRVEAAREALRDAVGTGGAVGLLCDNGPEWIAVDLAAHAAGLALVPIPDFFTAKQVAHALEAAGARALACADATRAAAFGFAAEGASLGSSTVFTSANSRRVAEMPDAAHKITFTSGTTAEPKGVWLSMDAQARTAHALASSMRGLGISRHLCALPLPVLLENVAGVYTALALGAECVCPPLEEVGLSGASGFDAARFLDALARYRPHSVIVLPQMLRVLVASLPAGPPFDSRVSSLKLVAVGGATTAPALIAAARARGLPAYEGYGLTECASVVSLNLPGADRPGSVGRALPHVRVRIGREAELEARTGGGVGYLGAAERTAGEWLRTGDLGAIDAEGFISITGRSRNVLVTSFGRNVSPEWPEALLMESGAIAQAVVFGDARPWLCAVLVPSASRIPDDELGAAVDRVNTALPDYARIGHWVRAHGPFTASNTLATANGRARREAIHARYAQALESAYRRAAASAPSHA